MVAHCSNPKRAPTSDRTSVGCMLLHQMHYQAATMHPISCPYASQEVFCYALDSTGLGGTTCRVPQLKGTSMHAPSAAVEACARISMMWLSLDVEGSGPNICCISCGGARPMTTSEMSAIV